MHNRTYRYFTGKALYAFGYGLSYTTFAYSDLKVPQQVQAGDPVQVEAEVHNTGSAPGDEVVELYLTQPRVFETLSANSPPSPASISMLARPRTSDSPQSALPRPG